MRTEFDLLIKVLGESGLTAGMSEDEVTTMLSTYPYKTVSLDSGELYAIGGKRLNDLQIVGMGALRAEMVGSSGKQILIDTLGPGRILAPALLFASENVLPVTLLTNDDSLIFRIGKGTFKEMMHHHPILMNNFITMTSNICTFLMKKIHQLTLRSLQGKIGDYLLQLCHENKDNKIMITSSWKDLSCRFGVNRQSLARSLSQLEDAGLIRVEGKHIEILRPHQLAQLE